jgi:hypothetical protein
MPLQSVTPLSLSRPTARDLDGSEIILAGNAECNALRSGRPVRKAFMLLQYNASGVVYTTVVGMKTPGTNQLILR